MVGVSDTDARWNLPDYAREAVVRHAGQLAEATAVVLDEWERKAGEKLSFPAAFLLELGAVCELCYWERLGLTVHREAGLPSFAEAEAALMARAEYDQSEFAGPHAAPLAATVLRVWFERLAWHGQTYLNAEVLVSDIDEDAFVEIVADFVWRHRHELQESFLTATEGTQE